MGVVLECKLLCCLLTIIGVHYYEHVKEQENVKRRVCGKSVTNSV